MEQTIPYEGRLECSGAQAQMYHQIYPELTDINIEVRMDEDGEMRCFGVEAALEARMVIYTEEQVELLQDVYALTQVCRPQFKEQVMEQLLMQNHSKCKVREQLSLPELQDNICRSATAAEESRWNIRRRWNRAFWWKEFFMSASCM